MELDNLHKKDEFHSKNHHTHQKRALATESQFVDYELNQRDSVPDNNEHSRWTLRTTSRMIDVKSSFNSASTTMSLIGHYQPRSNQSANGFSPYSSSLTEIEPSPSQALEEHTLIAQAVKLEPDLEEDQETSAPEIPPPASLQVKIEPGLGSCLYKAGNPESPDMSNPEENPLPFVDVLVKIEPSPDLGTVTPPTKGASSQYSSPEPDVQTTLLLTRGQSLGVAEQTGNSFDTEPVTTGRDREPGEIHRLTGGIPSMKQTLENSNRSRYSNFGPVRNGNFLRPVRDPPTMVADASCQFQRFPSSTTAMSLQHHPYYRLSQRHHRSNFMHSVSPIAAPVAVPAAHSISNDCESCSSAFSPYKRPPVPIAMPFPVHPYMFGAAVSPTDQIPQQIFMRKKARPACELCGKTFARKSTLQVHMRVHTGEKPFACSFCDRKFSQTGNLAAHERIHRGEKPFSCPYCYKRFTQSSAMRSHLRIHYSYLGNQ